MKNNPNHGNRLRPPHEAYEVKKKRAREKYASTQLKLNPFWRHNKILRDLANLYGTGSPIPISEFENRKFDISIYKRINMQQDKKYLVYDDFKIRPINQNFIIIWKI